jgi:hypothetical protein
MGAGVFSRGKSGAWRDADHSLHLVPRSRSGAICFLPLGVCMTVAGHLYSSEHTNVGYCCTMRRLSLSPSSTRMFIQLSNYLATELPSHTPTSFLPSSCIFIFHKNAPYLLFFTFCFFPTVYVSSTFLSLICQLFKIRSSVNPISSNQFKISCYITPGAVSILHEILSGYLWGSV